jgi:hypothetical protein
LVEEKAMGVAGGEIDAVTDAGFGDDGGERCLCAAEQDRSGSVLVVPGQEFSEDAFWSPTGGGGPLGELWQESVRRLLVAD